MFKMVKLAILIIALSVLNSCGGDSDNGEKPTEKERAFTIITAYAENGNNSAPTLQDYLDAGVTGVTADNLDALNTLVDSLNEADVDTTEELDALTAQLGVNILPVANAGDDKTVQVNQSISITGAGTDNDGSIISYQWTKGAIELATTASFDYTPTVVGTDILTLTVTDDDGVTASDSVNIVVTSTPNHAPIATDIATNTTEDNTKQITLIATDSDGDSLSYIIETNPTHGTTTIAGNIATYTPEANYNGSDSFTYKANDGSFISRVATVTITINAENDAPIANNTNANTLEDTTKDINLSATDIDGDNLTYIKVTDPAHGTFNIAGNIASYTPNANYNGSDSFTYKANDGTLDSNIATVTITVNAVNNTPIANTITVSTNENTTKAITLNASDIDGDSLTYIKVSNPAHGAVIFAGNTANYTPTNNYSGSDSFTFKVNDGTVDSNTATVSINVAKVDTSHRVESQSDAAKFLNRASFGPTQKSINNLLAKETYESWLQDQFDAPATLHLPKVTALATKMCANRNNGGDILLDSWEITYPRHQVWWETALGAEDQLRQRVALALSEIIVISDSEGLGLSEFQLAVTSFYDLFVKHAFGNYRDLLGEATLHPAMGDFLSMTRNQKANELEGIRPDENYAREILQLFSIGVHELNIDGSPKLDGKGKPIPTYKQKTIEEFAKVFTGWGYADIKWDGYFALSDHKIPLKAYEQYHDTSEKRLLNGARSPSAQTAKQDLDFALDNIFAHPNVAPFISAQLIQRLVTSNPTPAYIERVAKVFNDNGQGVKGDLKAVVSAILLDDEALAENKSASFGKLREPMLRISHLWRNFPPQAVSKVGHYWEPENTCGQGSYSYYIFWDSLDYFHERVGQGPLQAESVFNFFQPDHSPNGMLNDKGLKAPEFQIINENTYAGMSNALYYMMIYFSNADNIGDDYIHVTDDFTKLDLNQVTSLASDNNDLLNYLSLVMLNKQMSPQLRTILLEHLNQTEVYPDGINGQFVRAREAILLIVNSPEYLIQR